ncbi:hypothetical protein [Pontibacter ummariensis]|nr:hypothetical protein [Pontibacter ummariensis]
MAVLERSCYRVEVEVKGETAYSQLMKVRERRTGPAGFMLDHP